MAKPFPAGTRVVLVEDHRCASLGVTAGMTGEVVSFSQENEDVFWMGSYCVRLDHNTGAVWVNASAVANFGNGHSDADLVMAELLAQELVGREENFDVHRDEWLSAWLREKIFNELKARVK